jgi:hypothetical protein
MPTSAMMEHSMKREEDYSVLFVGYENLSSEVR